MGDNIEYERPTLVDFGENDNTVEPYGVVVIVVVAAAVVTVAGAITLVVGGAIATVGAGAHQTVMTTTWDSL